MTGMELRILKPVVGDGAGYVAARRRVEQSPLSDDPAVPRGTRGHIEDDSEGLYWVDFGEPYGVVACERSDIR
jgi:hypothetical protein